jgi:hypothetical protein
MADPTAARIKPVLVPQFSLEAIIQSPPQYLKIDYEKISINISVYR